MSDQRIKDLPDGDQPREKMERLGPGALTNAELIAVFIRTGLPGKSAVALGAELLERFGSLNGIAQAGLPGLTTIKGLGLAKAAQVAAAIELGSRLAEEKAEDTPMDAPELVYDLLAPRMRHLDREVLCVLLLNTKFMLIRVEEISVGSHNESIASPPKVFQPAILHNAHAIIIAHNHPSGDPAPSAADLQTTRRLSTAAEHLGIEFVDHIIIGRSSDNHDPYFSFREAGKLAP